jgi:hypothetical protein
VTATADLERLARTLVQPSGTRAAVAIVDHTPGGRLSKPLDAYPSGIGGRTRFGAAWQVDGGRGMPIAIATFDRQDDALRLVRLINGTADRTPRPAPRPPVLEELPEAPVRADVLPSMPVAATVSVAVESKPAGRCAGCGVPLPPGRRGQRRSTCSAACRQRARRHPAEEATSTATDSGTASVTPSRASSDPASLRAPDGDSSAARPELGRRSHPAADPGQRGTVQLPLLSG